MGLFGKKKKDYLQLNRKSKANIFSALQQLQLSAGASIEVKTLLRSMQSQISFQTDSNSEEVDRIDTEILKILKKAVGLIAKGQSTVALVDLRSASNKIRERAQYCTIGGTDIEIDHPVSKTHAEELQDQIDKNYADLVVLQNEFEEIKKLCKNEPENISLKTRLCDTKIKIDKLSNILASLMAELSNEITHESIAELNTIRDNLEKSRTYTQVDIEFMTDEYKKQLVELEKLNNQTRKSLDLISQGASSKTIVDEIADAESIKAKTSTGYGLSYQSTSDYETNQALDFTSNVTANDIRRAQLVLKNAIDEYDDKLEDEGEELKDIDIELRQALLARQKATPSECLVLDGKIDKLNSQRGSIINKIKRYRQHHATLMEKLTIVEKLANVQNIQAMESQIGKLSNGKLLDFEGLAMYLNEAVKIANKELEDINTAVLVSENEEINMTPASASSTIVSDAIIISKDEDKYSKLEEELGLTKA